MSLFAGTGFQPPENPSPPVSGAQADEGASSPVALERLPMAERFFAEALTAGRLAHAFVLKGRACGAMYHLALQVAKILNCQNPPESASKSGVNAQASAASDAADLSAMACGTCKNCRWIAQNAHPAVLTISRLTYQVSEHGADLSPEEQEKLAKKAAVPKQINVHQVERLLAQLGLSSEYARVVIFTDAEALPATLPSGVTPPYEWTAIEANAEKSFHIRPLERNLFNTASANRFLKTLEEPPPRTLFFFIVETEEQLLETIVSRCQVVPCARSAPSLEANTSLENPDAPSGGAVLNSAGETGAAPLEAGLVYPPEAVAFLDAFPARLSRGGDVYALAAEFEQVLIADGGLTHVQALNLFQQVLRRQFITSADTAFEPDFHRYRTTQEALDLARRMLDSKTHESQSLLNLFLTLSRG